MRKTGRGTSGLRALHRGAFALVVENVPASGVQTAATDQVLYCAWGGAENIGTTSNRRLKFSSIGWMGESLIFTYDRATK